MKLVASLLASMLLLFVVGCYVGPPQQTQPETIVIEKEKPVVIDNRGHCTHGCSPYNCPHCRPHYRPPAHPHHQPHGRPMPPHGGHGHGRPGIDFEIEIRP